MKPWEEWRDFFKVNMYVSFLNNIIIIKTIVNKAGCLDLNRENTEHIFMSNVQNAGQNHDIVSPLRL
jgi:hypothetical protein